MGNKKLMDKYKNNQMNTALVEKTIEFFDYAMDDALKTFEVFHQKIKNTNDLLKSIFNYPEFTGFYYNSETIKMSTGSLVNDCFLNFLTFHCTDYEEKEEKYEEKKLLFQLACLKNSKLDIQGPYYKILKNIWNRLFDNKNSKYLKINCRKKELIKMLQSLPDFQKKEFLSKKNYLDTPFNQSSIKVFLEQADSHAVFNALVTGGRCNNEIPYEFKVKRTADIDLSSCYGSAIEDFIFPIGKPSVYTAPPNKESNMTLKNFLQKYEDQFVENLFTITVQGYLSFQQDLIYSKIVSKNSLKNTLKKHNKSFFDDGYDDNAHINADMVLLRNEIVNGIITSDLLENIRAVSSNNELKEWMELEVVTAVWWDKNKKIEKTEDWVNAILYDQEHIEYNDIQGVLEDKRNKAWLGIPLKHFIQPLLTYRSEIKKKIKNEVNEEVKVELNAKQNSVKLMVNTLYGVICSIYFDSGNTVVANNITARARSEVWKMAKALGIRQTITDGGFYTLEKMPSFNKKKGKKPSFHTLSDYNLLSIHRNIQMVSLGNRNWKKIFEENPSSLIHLPLDQEASQHLNFFWNEYDLKMKMKIEHKLQNISLETAYINKANYMFLTYNEESKKWDQIVQAVRGIDKKGIAKDYPILQLMKSILFNDVKNVFLPERLDYKTSTLLNLNLYRKIQELNQKYIDIDDDLEQTIDLVYLKPEYKDLIPGDKITLKRRFKLLNTHFFLKNKEEYEKRKRRRSYTSGFETINDNFDIIVLAMEKDQFPKTKKE